MRAVIQRATSGEVRVGGRVVGRLTFGEGPLGRGHVVHHRRARARMTLALKVRGAALGDPGPRVLPRPLDPGQGRSGVGGVGSGAHGREDNRVAHAHAHPQREAHGFEELNERVHVGTLHDQVGRLAVVAGARPVLDASLGRQDQQLAAVSGPHPGQNLGRQRGQPGRPIRAAHVNDRQIGTLHDGAPALERPLLARGVPPVRGRAEGGHGLVEDVSAAFLRQGNHPQNRRFRRWVRPTPSRPARFASVVPRSQRSPPAPRRACVPAST